MNNSFRGYQIHNYQYYLPQNVLLSNENEKITVGMIKEALDYMLEKIAKKNPIIKKYNNAYKTLKSLKQKYSNQTPVKVSKEEIKDALDVITEIKNENLNDEQKDYNDKICMYCKLLIDFWNLG